MEMYDFVDFYESLLRKAEKSNQYLIDFYEIFGEGQRGRVMICLIVLSYFLEKGREGKL